MALSTSFFDNTVAASNLVHLGINDPAVMH
jgi:hypothetical protein